MSNPYEGLEAVVNAGRLSATAEARQLAYPIEDKGDSVPIMLLDEGQTAQVPQELLDAVESRRGRPRRASGKTTHRTLASLVAHVARCHHPHESTIWIDTECIRVIYNDHANEHAAHAPGWGDHQAFLYLDLSPSFLAWHRLASQGEIDQADLCSFLDAHLEDVAPPTAPGEASAAALLELVKHLTVVEKATYSRGVNPRTGEINLIHRTEHGDGTTPIPRAFRMVIPIYAIVPKLYEIEVRVAFRVVNGRPVFTLTLHRVDDLRALVLDDIERKLVEATGLPIFRGCHP